MKTFKQSYPRRRAMLATPFTPLSDSDFRELVSSGVAIPGRQGTSLFVSKWRDGPGLETETFLKVLHAQESQLEVRRYKTDVNIRVITTAPPKRGVPPLSAHAPKSSA